MNSGFSMKGTDSVLAMLERVRENTLHSAAMSGMDTGLRALCEEAKMLCPVETGELRSSIAVRMTQDGGEVYAGAPHAAHVEMGTADCPAQPFLYPALRARESGILLDVSRAILRQVNGRT